jgi:hypothetical protein
MDAVGTRSKTGTGAAEGMHFRELMSMRHQHVLPILASPVHCAGTDWSLLHTAERFNAFNIHLA